VLHININLTKRCFIAVLGVAYKHQPNKAAIVNIGSCIIYFIALKYWF